MISTERPFLTALSGYQVRRRRSRSVRLLPTCPICLNIFDPRKIPGRVALDGGTDSKRCQTSYRMRLARAGGRT